MKKFDTAYISNKKADLKEIIDIIRNLFTEDTEENPDVRTKMTVAEIEKEFLTRKLTR